jgi:hypothetical protein
MLRISVIYTGFSNPSREDKSKVTARKYLKSWNNYSKLKRKIPEWPVDLTAH